MQEASRKHVEVSARFVEYADDPLSLARRLLGQRLVRQTNTARLSGRIVEVEAYLGAEDRAAHTYGGRRTDRNASMYLPSGHAYVYFTYGLHHCLNVVCGQRDEGVAVLIRALEPEEGIELMMKNRPQIRRAEELCSGPAKLCQALGINRGLDGESLIHGAHLWIERTRQRSLPTRLIERTARVGVGYAGSWAEQPLRLFIRKNPHVSRGLPSVPR